VPKILTQSKSEKAAFGQKGHQRLPFNMKISIKKQVGYAIKLGGQNFSSESDSLRDKPCFWKIRSL